LVYPDDPRLSIALARERDSMGEPISNAPVGEQRQKAIDAEPHSSLRDPLVPPPSSIVTPQPTPPASPVIEQPVQEVAPEKPVSSTAVPAPHEEQEHRQPETSDKRAKRSYLPVGIAAAVLLLVLFGWLIARKTTSTKTDTSTAGGGAGA